MYDIPFLDLPPLCGAAGAVRLPGSKSISNRVLLLAGLASGTTTVLDVLDADDTQVMLAALRQLGCAVEQHGPSVRVTGLAGKLAVHEAAYATDQASLDASLAAGIARAAEAVDSGAAKAALDRWVTASGA